MVKKVLVNDEFQENYEYELVAPIGTSFDPEFKPELTPEQMLSLGVFSGVYFHDKPSEFPKDWYSGAKLSEDGMPDDSLNYFQINASQPLKTWQERGWIYPDDPRGWFQWYCRYYLGRRIPDEDQRQIKRWKAMTRHIAQVKKNCQIGDLACRRRQRQALMHWAYDSRMI